MGEDRPVQDVRSYDSTCARSDPTIPTHMLEEMAAKARCRFVELYRRLASGKAT